MHPFSVLVTYVDDAMIFSITQESANKIIKILRKQFEVHIMKTGKFLGFQYHRNDHGCIHLHQTNYINNILDKYNMRQANPASTPL